MKKHREISKRAEAAIANSEVASKRLAECMSECERTHEVLTHSRKYVLKVETENSALRTVFEQVRVTVSE